MVLISKHDKKVWETYVSNFDKFVMIPDSNNINGLKKCKNTVIYNIRDLQIILNF